MRIEDFTDGNIEYALGKNVKELVEKKGLKIRTFYRKWDGEDSPKKCLDLEKLKYVKVLLLTEREKKIYEIAKEAGFCDQYYFSKWFKKMTGKSPREYIKNHGKEVAARSKHPSKKFR
ncbi:MAG: helix-turn-helix domain-containing protein [Candidatus Pacearchaeota archaeon]